MKRKILSIIILSTAFTTVGCKPDEPIQPPETVNRPPTADECSQIPEKYRHDPRYLGMCGGNVIPF